ncbi:cholesteryl ester transfer protein [Scleropages formosus]|nr:cholesteryl ester transfer protein [Scleropages formosus]
MSQTAIRPQRAEPYVLYPPSPLGLSAHRRARSAEADGRTVDLRNRWKTGNKRVELGRLCKQGIMELPVLFLLLGLTRVSRSCLDPISAYRFTGAVCRLTYPAALVLNEKTAKVIEAAFQHARYPDMKGEKSLLFVGKVHYNLNNLEIHDLLIGGSEVELRANDRIAISISNVSATFRGTMQYGYGSWLIDFGHSVDFEIESHIDLVVNPKLYCGKDKVAADTSDCYLTFHKLQLILHGDREPGWLKKVFTDFVTFTVKVVIKSQICKEINKLADTLADFIQRRAERFLSDGDIGVDVSVVAAPTLTSNYIESYHKGLTRYNNTSAVIEASAFNPAQLTEDRMIYFWLSDELLDPLVKAAHLDGRFVRSIGGQELADVFEGDLSASRPAFLTELLSSETPLLKTWSVSVPRLRTTPAGTSVRGVAAVELTAPSSDLSLYFEADVEVIVKASYADKRLTLNAALSSISALNGSLSPAALQLEDAHTEYLREAVEKIGVPKVTSYLERGITTLMNKQGLDLFEIINPIVLPGEGYVIVQLDFGFPQHLLVDFLKKTLESQQL